MCAPAGWGRRIASLVEDGRRGDAVAYWMTSILGMPEQTVAGMRDAPFWAGMEAPTMQNLAEELDSKMERLGFEKEKRAFRPHITLARARDSRIDSSLVAAAAKYAEYDFGSFTVDRMFLFKSILKPTGAVYERLKEYPL